MAKPADDGAANAERVRRIVDVLMALGEGEVTTFRSSDWAERAFCPKCGTALYWRALDSDVHSINPFVLKYQSALNFTSEVYIDNKPDAYAFAGDRPRLTEAEVVG